MDRVCASVWLRHCYCGMSRWSRVSFDGSGVVWLHACRGRPAANAVMLRRPIVSIKRIKETVELHVATSSSSIQFIREVLWAVRALGGSGVAGTFLHTVRTRGMYTGESSRWLMGRASVSRSTLSDPGRFGLWSDTVGSSCLSCTHVLRRVHTESRRCC